MLRRKFVKNLSENRLAALALAAVILGFRIGSKSCLSGCGFEFR